MTSTVGEVGAVASRVPGQQWRPEYGGVCADEKVRQYRRSPLTVSPVAHCGEEGRGPGRLPRINRSGVRVPSSASIVENRCATSP